MDDARAIAVDNTRNLIRNLKITREELYPGIYQAESDHVPSFTGDAYPLQEKKGCVLIMSNEFEKSPPKAGKRVKASREDVRKMKTLWKDKVGCDLFDVAQFHADGELQSQRVFNDEESRRANIRTNIIAKCPDNVYENMAGEKMKELLASLADTKNDYAFIVVVISTHGAMVPENWVVLAEQMAEWMKEVGIEEDVEEKNRQALENFIKRRKSLLKTGAPRTTVDAMAEVFFGEDWMPVREKEIMELFYNDKNPKIREIPKLFILDYCRGDAGETHKDSASKRPKSGAEHSATVTPEHLSPLPLMNDTVTAHATHRFYEAFDGEQGSWLITAIDKVFSSCFKHASVVDMLTKVNSEVRGKCIHEDAMSIFESSLVKIFYLFERRADDQAVTISPQPGELSNEAGRSGQ